MLICFSILFRFHTLFGTRWQAHLYLLKMQKQPTYSFIFKTDSVKHTKALQFLNHRNAFVGDYFH